jgi:hypothetical protein
LNYDFLFSLISTSSSFDLSNVRIILRPVHLAYFYFVIKFKRQHDGDGDDDDDDDEEQVDEIIYINESE